MSGLETMQLTQDNEIITSLEDFFEPADLLTDEKNCADDRSGNFIHMFGGAFFLAYTQMVVQEALRPGSSQDLATMTEQTLFDLQAAGVKNLGIHSDVAKEHGHDLRLDQDGPIGCAYGEFRSVISRLIAENGESIIAKARRDYPDLFMHEDDLRFGRKVIGAHDRLAQSETALPNGRELLRRGKKAGAATKVFEGAHRPTSKGSVNRIEGTRLNSEAARNADLPTYDHELWASDKLLSMLPDAPDAKKASIASVIDIIGTLRALNVKETIVHK